MAKLETLFEALHQRVDLSTAEELKLSCELIVDVQSMTGAEVDCIYAAYKNGPLFDGDIPSKNARDRLLEGGYMAKVVVKGEGGFNALTQKGAWAYRLLLVGY